MSYFVSRFSLTVKCVKKNIQIVVKSLSEHNSNIRSTQTNYVNNFHSNLLLGRCWCVWESSFKLLLCTQIIIKKNKSPNCSKKIQNCLFLSISERKRNFKNKIHICYWNLQTTPMKKYISSLFWFHNFFFIIDLTYRH